MHAPKKFGSFELESSIIFVAKKQSDNLKRLIALFNNNQAMQSKRVIIIDDEADSASIGYSKKAGLIKAKTIATQISSLRSKINESSYLQVTATPYSLYLQPDEIEVDNVIDFRPTRPAFTKLVPVPSEYVGGETYFGASSRSEADTLESLIHHTVDHNEFDRLKKSDRRSFKVEDVLSEDKLAGFRAAIINFIVGGTIKRVNGGKEGAAVNKLRYSFLLHSESGKPAHDWQETVTKAIIKKLLELSKTDELSFNALIRLSYEDFVRSLKIASQPIPSFQAVRSGVVEAMKNDFITITKVNSDDDVAAMLDDSGQLRLRSPLNIFLGGQVLDRGITLASLIGFYYGRRPNKYQQDTVLQHSRMYGYRRLDLAVTRFYTSRLIRFAMEQMEEFDSSLRATVEAGGDRSIQFIRKAADGSIVPCSPNKILVATTQTLRPNKLILPIGFQTGHKTGKNGIGNLIEKLDAQIEATCGFNAKEPKLVPLSDALALLDMIKPTLHFDEDDAPEFDWGAAKAALTHLSHQAKNRRDRGKVYLWAARDRNSARFAGESSHATYIETPDSEKTEGKLAKTYAIDQPILFLLRQNGDVDQGWLGTPFYWPVIRAQSRTPTAIYTSQTIS